MAGRDMSFAKYKLNNKHFAIFAVVPLLVVTALVNVNCPVCTGKGSVSSNLAMENVKITDVEAVELGIMRNSCGMFLMYNYSITLSIENSGPDTATGWLLLHLIDYYAGKPLDRQYTVAEIPGNKSLKLTYRVWFLSGTDEPRKTEVDAEVVNGDVPCETCKGTGRVPLNTWPLVNSLKGKFIQLAQIETPWAIPPWPIDIE
jgi:hypothetical protein